MAKDKNKNDQSNVISRNRKAFHEYIILETFMAGIVLTGTEIKSVRAGKVSLTESYAKITDAEVWLLNSNISHYEQGNRYNHKPDRPRKLLLTKQEIRKLIGKTKESSLTLVPLKMFIKDGWAKIELGLAKGKQVHDKRQTMAERTSKREIERAMKGKY